MSISRKVLWIFLSILFMIFALGLTIMIYQASNTRMHDVLHKLIIFNNSVHQLQKSQEEIAIALIINR
jgi:fatty acid desaturase